MKEPAMATSMKKLVDKFTKTYGVEITWLGIVKELNPRGIEVTVTTGDPHRARVLLLKEKFTPLKALEGVIGLTQDYTRYILCKPDIKLEKDMTITDNHNTKWKLGVIDWFDVGGVAVAKQISVLEVE